MSLLGEDDVKRKIVFAVVGALCVIVVGWRWVEFDPAPANPSDVSEPVRKVARRSTAVLVTPQRVEHAAEPTSTSQGPPARPDAPLQGVLKGFLRDPQGPLVQNDLRFRRLDGRGVSEAQTDERGWFERALPAGKWVISWVPRPSGLCDLPRELERAEVVAGEEHLVELFVPGDAVLCGAFTVEGHGVDPVTNGSIALVFRLVNRDTQRDVAAGYLTAHDITAGPEGPLEGKRGFFRVAGLAPAFYEIKLSLDFVDREPLPITIGPIDLTREKELYLPAEEIPFARLLP